jgi:hypothetical protein
VNATAVADVTAAASESQHFSSFTTGKCMVQYCCNQP